MMFLENLKMAFVSLGNAKLRSFLTMLGIIIGVAAVVAILSIGEGVKQAVRDQITGVVNANAIAVASGKIAVGKSSSAGSAAQSFGASTLTAADITALQKLTHVEAVAPLSIISGIVSTGGTPASNALLLATTPDFAKTQSLKFADGRFLTTADDNQYVAVLGGGAKAALFGANPALNQTVTIRGAKFTVIGDLKTSDAAASGFSAGPSFDDAVYIPATAAEKLVGSKPPISRLLVQVDQTTNVPAVADAMRAALKTSHGGQEDFTVLTQKDLLSTIDSVLNLLTTFIVAIASISLLVGGIGIMNIMLVSVTERTREIGLRKAIGASSLMVLGQFLIEAVVLSLLGGALGIAAAIGMATLAGKAAKITPIFTPQSIILAVSVSAVVGVVFGIAPAIQAARKRPIQALKAV
ncbi:MAG TPA: ABC transporter permease [Candidatus Saccharimonadia bacterium]